MTFYERVEILCQRKGVKPQSKEFMDAAGVASGTITNWKQKGAEPEKISTYSKIADYFGVTLDYLAGRIGPTTGVMNEDDDRLLRFYHGSDVDGKAVIMGHAVEEYRRSEKEKTDSTREPVAG